MTVIGGVPAQPVEYGRCLECQGWGWGPWIEDLTAGIALVQHCAPPPPDPPPTE